MIEPRLDTLLLASGNPGKLRELRGLLGPYGVSVTGLDQLKPRPEEIAEVGESFWANATLKAVGYGRSLGLASLADDSGLVVDALDGAPGIHSARFSGPRADAASNNALLLRRLEGVPEVRRGAHFACAMALYIPAGPLRDALLARAARIEGVDIRTEYESGEPVLTTFGRTAGRILTAAHGHHGFGYDPLFFSDDLAQSFAEASLDAKAAVSHRGRALGALLPLFA